MTLRDVFKISICCGTSAIASFRSIEVIISDEVRVSLCLSLKVA